MNEEQKKYKIKQIETYYELTESERKKESLLFAGAMITLSIGANAIASAYGGNYSSLSMAVFGSANLGLSLTAIKYMVNAISKKTILKQQIENLYHDLENDTQEKEEKTRGVKWWILILEMY